LAIDDRLIPGRRHRLTVDGQIPQIVARRVLAGVDRSRRSSTSSRGAKKMLINVLLWIVQVLLALLFLFAGGMKLVLPLDALSGPVALPGLLLRFIGVAEVAGAVGIILPWLLNIRPRLTSLAAAGLTIIMAGATAITVLGGEIGLAYIPLIVGLLAAAVAYGRWQTVIGATGQPQAAPRLRPTMATER
jgi:hypothetical protein